MCRGERAAVGQGEPDGHRDPEAAAAAQGAGHQHGAQAPRRRRQADLRTRESSHPIAYAICLSPYIYIYYIYTLPVPLQASHRPYSPWARLTSASCRVCLPSLTGREQQQLPGAHEQPFVALQGPRRREWRADLPRGLPVQAAGQVPHARPVIHPPRQRYYTRILQPHTAHPSVLRSFFLTLAL